MNVLYREAASDDIVRQFRYYLLSADAPEIAVRFREAVRPTIQSLSQNPHVGPRYSSSNPRLQNLRSWPVAGFEAIQVIHAMASLPESERVRYWHEQFMPLAAQEHALRERLQTAGQQISPQNNEQ